MVDVLWRERELTELLHRYCALVDANQQQDVVALFEPDAVYDHGHGRVYRGHAELCNLFGALDSNEATSHHLSNIGFSHRDDGTVASSSYVYAYHRRVGTGETVHVWGRYEDLLVATDDGWRFRRRALLGAAESGVAPDEGWNSRYERPFRVGRE